MKKDKDEEFRRRVLGEKTLSKFQKEQLKQKMMAQRDEFDLNNCGNYRMVFPIRNDPVIIRIQ